MEVITILATAATTLIAVVSGFGWIISRMDTRFAAMDARFAAMDARFDAQAAKFDERFTRIDQDNFEVKIAIARLEGPTPRLIAAR